LIFRLLLGIIWIFGQNALFDIDDLRFCNLNNSSITSNTSSLNEVSNFFATSVNSPLTNSSGLLSILWWGTWSSPLKNSSKSLIDNAFSGSLLNAMWLFTVTLYLPILYGMQHKRLFSDSSVTCFGILCAFQYFLWNILRVYIVNRHGISLDMQRYGCWKKCSSASAVCCAKLWRVGHRFKQGDTIVCYSSPITWNNNLTSRSDEVAHSDENSCYFQLVSPSSCMFDSQVILPIGDAAANGVDSDTYKSSCFPLVSVAWKFCNPVLTLLIFDAETSRHEESNNVFMGKLAYLFNYILKIPRCAYFSLLWDRGYLINSSIVSIVLQSIMFLCILQAFCSLLFPCVSNINLYMRGR
jgi:hypothetical protein